MVDLEDTLSHLNKIREALKEGLKFLTRLEFLLGNYDAIGDFNPEGTITVENLIRRINDVIIFKKEDKNIDFNKNTIY